MTARDHAADEAYRLPADLAQPDQYSNYQLPGGGDYRELLLTLPGKDGSTEAQRKARFASIADEMADATSARYAQLHAERAALADEQLGEGGQTYKSDHWSEANVLAHSR